MAGLLDEQQDPNKAEIARLEAMIAQFEQQGPGIAQQLAAPGLADDERMTLENLQQQQQLGTNRIQGLLSQVDSSQTPAQQEIASLTAQIAQAESGGQGGAPGDPAMQMLQAQGGEAGPQGDIYGLLGYNAGGGIGGGTGQEFEPTMDIGNMQQIYAAMATGADDPAAIGENYVQSMQRNDQLRAANQESRYRVTDAMRPKPFGGGYTDSEGYFVATTWDPNMNNGRGDFRTTRLGKKMPNTFTVGGVQYVRNYMQPDISQPDAFVPAVDPQQAGVNAGLVTEGQDLGGLRAVNRQSQAELAQDMSLTERRITRLLNAENFSEATGPMDNAIAWIGGAAAGGEDSLMNRELRMLHNELATIIVADWKGAISNKELDFFKSTVPAPTDHHQVWKTWYETKFLPAKQFAMEVARGMHDYTDMDLETYINNVSPASSAIMQDPLVLKYLEDEIPPELNH